MQLNGDSIEISFQKGCSFSWAKSTGNFNGYNLYIAKNIEGIVNYDWENARIYLPGANTTSFSVEPGGVSTGSYVACVQAWNTSTDEKSNQSNFVYFKVTCSHTSKTKTKEAITVATCTISGSYEEVIYCEKCNKELERKKNQ